MTTSGDLFLDTNVLLAATAPARAEHAAALRALDGPGGRLVSGQVLREYLSVATRPIEANGLGLPLTSALGNVRQFAKRVRFLDEDEHVRRTLLELLAEIPCQGRIVHDTNIVATMLAHGVRTLLTLNARDFARYEGKIGVVGL